jgi:transcriptional regulator with XRE-family HTH domain
VAEDTFGARLKQLRAQAGLTQQELADRAGLHKQSVSRLEQDEYSPTWPTVQALAKALGVNSLAFEGTVEPSPKTKQPARRGRPPKAPPPPAEPSGEKRKGRKKE